MERPFPWRKQVLFDVVAPDISEPVPHEKREASIEHYLNSFPIGTLNV
jgi:hypothetical protein